MSMRKIAFHIQKGGVGKTTIAGNVAFASSLLHKKTVLVDCDPQANSSSWYIANDSDVKHELSDVLRGLCGVVDSLVCVTDTFYVLPTFAIDGTLKQYAETQLNDEPFIFEDLTHELERLSFQVALFDLSPGMSRLEKCVLLAMDEVVTPLTPEFFSVDGIQIFTNEIKKINKAYRKNVKHRRIIINSVNNSFRRHRLFHERLANLDRLKLVIDQLVDSAVDLDQSVEVFRVDHTDDAT